MVVNRRYMFGKQKVIMEWGEYEDCVAVVVLFRCRYTTSKIHTTLKVALSILID